ncbi:MAG TPA: hypothetical protein VHY91_10060 [Pirellulales bacterium]|jgi:hypothetical protein|nr:hypothetical protein [Pirellulales bacterium]
MSKLLCTAVASGLLAICSVGAFAADGYNSNEGSSVQQPAAPPVRLPQEKTGNARRFYSYQPAPVRGRRVQAPPYIRPASAKALGNY